MGWPETPLGYWQAGEEHELEITMYPREIPCRGLGMTCLG